MTAGPVSQLTIEERLARLEITDAARRLVVRYATACDAQDPDLLRPIFASDVVLTSPGLSRSGIDDVLGFYRDVWSRSSIARRHFITNTEVDVSNADSASARSYFLFVSSDDTTPQIGWGTYQDTFERRDGTLLFTRKHIVVELDVDVRRGWATELAAAFGTTSATAP